MQYPTEHAVQELGRVNAMLLIQGYDDLAIGVGLERVWSLDLFPQDLVVVDLAVDCQCNLAILAQKWLGASVNADDRETLILKENIAVVAGLAPDAFAGK